MRESCSVLRRSILYSARLKIRSFLMAVIAAVRLYLAADGFRMLISPVEMEDGTITSSRMCAVV